MKRVIDIHEVVEILAGGGVIVFPTETSYGLGCDATNAEAVERIFAIKGRPSGKGLPVLIPGAEEVAQFAQLPSRAQELAHKYWPGALNIVAPIAEGSPITEACSQDGMQSVRVSSHAVAGELVRQFGKPVVATSANISGDEPIFDPAFAEASFAGGTEQPDAVFDAGVLPFVPASTTIKVVGEGVEVLRQGSILV